VAGKRFVIMCSFEKEKLANKSFSPFAGSHTVKTVLPERDAVDH
jgi:hypothetical protein